MFGFFKKKPSALSVFDIKYKFPNVNEIIKEDCKKIIAIGISHDPRFKDPDAFDYDQTKKSSLPYALMDVPYTSKLYGKSGGRPRYIGTDICIEAIVYCFNISYPSWEVSESHLVKLGYKYASSNN